MRSGLAARFRLLPLTGEAGVERVVLRTDTVDENFLRRVIVQGTFPIGAGYYRDFGF